MERTTKGRKTTKNLFNKFNDQYLANHQGPQPVDFLTHSFQMHPFSKPPENIGKPYVFLIFLGVRERVHWERMD